MPLWLLGLVNRPWFLKATGIVAAAGALLVAVFRLIGFGRKQQQAIDAKVTTDILEKQRDAASNPIAPDAARQRLRSGKL